MILGSPTLGLYFIAWSRTFLCLLSQVSESSLLPWSANSEGPQQVWGGFPNRASASGFHRIGVCLPSCFYTCCSKLTVLLLLPLKSFFHPLFPQCVGSPMMTVLPGTDHKTMSGRREVGDISRGNFSFCFKSTLIWHSHPGFNTYHIPWFLFRSLAWWNNSVVQWMVGWFCWLQTCVPPPVYEALDCDALCTGCASKLLCSQS